MGPLPAERITPCRPFTKTGTDFAGPFFVKMKAPSRRLGRSTYRYLFVSLPRLFIWAKYQVLQLKLALERLVARWGVPAAIFSDNGTKFIGARNELIQLKLNQAKKWNSVSQIATTLLAQCTMIPPRAPHSGGLVFQIDLD